MIRPTAPVAPITATVSNTKARLSCIENAKEAEELQPLRFMELYFYRAMKRPSIAQPFGLLY